MTNPPLGRFTDDELMRATHVRWISKDGYSTHGRVICKNILGRFICLSDRRETEVVRREDFTSIISDKPLPPPSPGVVKTRWL